MQSAVNTLRYFDVDARSIVRGGDWDTSNDDNAVSIVHKAIDRGINLFDVAPVYGWNHAERVLGKALTGGMRGTVIIVSKCGLT